MFKSIRFIIRFCSKFSERNKNIGEEQEFVK